MPKGTLYLLLAAGAIVAVILIIRSREERAAKAFEITSPAGWAVSYA